jgi:hypothetical protein
MSGGSRLAIEDRIEAQRRGGCWLISKVDAERKVAAGGQSA